MTRSQYLTFTRVYQAQLIISNLSEVTKLEQAKSLILIDKKLRNIGMIWAYELDAQIDIDKVTQSFIDNGVFIRPINRTIYFMPPFTINNAEMMHMVQVSEKSIKLNV